MEHLSLEIFDREGRGSKFAYLPDNASITINDNSDIFGSGDIWSYSFTLNIFANAHIFGTSGEIHGDRLHDAVDKRRARLWVEGTPSYSGYLSLGDDVDVSSSGDVRVSFESGRKAFSALIEGAKANQVPMMDDVPFGMALYRKRKGSTGAKLSISAKLHSVITQKIKNPFDGSLREQRDVVHLEQDFGGEINITKVDFDGDKTPAQEYPRMVFPRGTFLDRNSGVNVPLNYLNTDIPFDSNHPFCNIALCYQKSEYKKPVSSGDDDDDAEDLREYTVMPADRVNSAPNFFVIYWILALMKHLKIRVDENQMMDVEDLRRLFFVNTKCEYKTPVAPAGKSSFERTDCPYKINPDLIPEDRRSGYLDASGAYLSTSVGKITLPSDASSPETVYHHELCTYIFHEYLENVTIKSEFTESSPSGESYKSENSYAHLAYASSECFPDSDISTVINSLESAFGLRFMFNQDYSAVRIILLRNVFRGGDVQTLNCDILEEGGKQETSVRGFRMTYGQDDDTHFYYKGFADLLTHKTELWPDTSDDHDYSKWDTDITYDQVIQKKSVFNTTCYVTPVNGNAYGCKNDDLAKRLSEYYPEIFEFAGFMDAEDGDCSGEEETIHTVSVGFIPAIMNDVSDGKNGKQRFALFLDEETLPRRYNYRDPKDDEYFCDPTRVYNIKKLYDSLRASGHQVVRPGCFEVLTDLPIQASPGSYQYQYSLRDRQDLSNHLEHYHISDVAVNRIFSVNYNVSGYIVEGYRLYLQDNFEPNDDGIHPIEQHEWGLTLGILRGTGSAAQTNYTEDPDDGEGNSTWDIIPGKDVTAHPDTCDNYGNLWDYNGSVKIASRAGAIAYLNSAYRYSNFDLTGRSSDDFLVRYSLIYYVLDADGKKHRALLAATTSGRSIDYFGGDKIHTYVNSRLRGKTVSTDPGDTNSMYYADKPENGGLGLLITTDATPEMAETLLKLERLAYGASTETVTIDDGAGAQFGRFSLKLRAKKPNPMFNSKLPEGPDNRRYLEIDTPELRGRGLADQFYKEFSYWIRNARTKKFKVRMELAQLLSIDKTKKVTIGGVTGFIKKMQYSINIKSGLGPVTVEMLYL